ncbi:MAG TPA: TylF/MycF/NovP-related O-methyltransferase [Candidatus Binataceae bacterium]|nr:TylF/MycF/NovP-related O-methyltransferase [Candidatus Binataceae bacterium]
MKFDEWGDQSEMMTSIQRIAHLAADHRRFRRVYQKYRRHTMISELTYVGNLRLMKNIASVEGDVIECGTWRGGMIAGIADVLGSRRRYYLCDSFQGLPPAKEIDGAAARAWQSDTGGPEYYNNCTASEEEARAAISLSAATDYQIVKGWFEQTLPRLPARPIALLRMDADWYDSTKCILDNLAERVASGGLIIVDDYYQWEGCTLAVNEFAARKKWRIRQNIYGVCYIVV